MEKQKILNKLDSYRLNRAAKRALCIKVLTELKVDHNPGDNYFVLRAMVEKALYDK